MNTDPHTIDLSSTDWQLARLSKIKAGDVLQHPETGNREYATPEEVSLGVFVDDNGRTASGHYVWRNVADVLEKKDAVPDDLAGYQNVRNGVTRVGDLFVWGPGASERIVVIQGDAACVGRKILDDGTAEFPSASLTYRVYRKIPTPKQDVQRAKEPTPNFASEAIKLVLGDRNDSYGNPRDDYEGTAKIWSGLLRKKLTADITPEEAILMMVGLKLNREAHKHKDDNLIDAHGYLLCLQWAITREKPQP